MIAPAYDPAIHVKACGAETANGGRISYKVLSRSVRHRGYIMAEKPDGTLRRFRGLIEVYDPAAKNAGGDRGAYCLAMIRGDRQRAIQWAAS